jgi:hypothetical protein
MLVHSGETGTRILKPFRSSGPLIGCVEDPAYPAYPAYGYGYGYPGPYAGGGYVAVGGGWYNGWHGGGWRR